MTVEAFLLTVYMLVWPLLVVGVLFVITRAFTREWRDARRAGEDII